MKKLLFAVAMLMGLCITAYAQKEPIYFYTEEGMSFRMRNWIDRSAMIFYYDGDSDGSMIMKNYKKEGNKETFDLYPNYDPNTKYITMTIITDPDLQIASDMNLKTQNATEKGPDFTTVYGFLTEEQQKAYSKMTGGKDDGPDGGLEGGNVVDKAKEKGKALLNKGKDLFKKKK